MAELFRHPYAAFLPKVSKPTRYLGSEHGTRRKDWRAAQARVCLAFPDIYDIGMSHLGFRILYKLLNDDPRTLAERCYAPWVDMRRELLSHGEFLRSLESHRPLCDFDVVGFSLQYELTFTNILMMLDLGGIPLRSAHRSEDDPLVIAGGPVATHAEPIADFIDAIVIGDGEELAGEIALMWTENQRQGLDREGRLLELAKLEGVYVPALYETHRDPDSGFEVVSGPRQGEVPFPVRRRLVDDLSRFPFPDDGPVGGPEAIFDRMSIEIARGCTEGCRFCQAGMIYRPVRERDPKQVLATVERALAKSGQDEVSLTALSTADVSCISPLIKKLVEKTAPERVSLGVASLRAYGLAEDLLDDMRKVRASGLTFAPEAGTQRMRDVINKNVTEEQLLETAERVFSRRYEKMKLYFMIGLPTEEDDDVLGIVNVGKNALAVGKRHLKGRARVTVSVSTHVPKPHTPFQWCAMDSPTSIGHKQQLLKSAARGVRNLGLRLHHSETSVLEGILARGDRTLAPVIEWAYQHGASFDSWEDQVRMDLWQQAFREHDVDTSRYLGTIATSARVPWDHIDVGLEPGFLAREYRRALKHRLSPPCGKPKGMFVHHTNREDAEQDERRLVCYHCGVACDLTQMRTERIEFLQALGAHKRLPLVTNASKLEPDTHEAAQPERLRPEQIGGCRERFRLKFAKLGPMALLGHLDLMREVPRVIRRAGIRTAYTRGFRPKPELTFGPALALGVASLGEYLDVTLLGADEKGMVERLNRVAPEGLRFVAARRLSPADPKLGKVITGARYVIAFALADLARLGGVGRLEAAVHEFVAAERVVVRRQVEGIGRLIDVRSHVTQLELGGETSRRALAAAGVIGDLECVSASVTCAASGSVRPREIAEALWGQAGIPHLVVRQELHGNQASPLDLERFRPRVAPCASPAAVPGPL